MQDEDKSSPENLEANQSISKNDVENFLNAQLDHDPDKIKLILKDLEAHPEDGFVARLLKEEEKKIEKFKRQFGFD